MRMNCDRLLGEIKPYEILVRYREKYGAGDYSEWGTWRFSSAHQTESGRDVAYDKLSWSDIKEYKFHLNEFEYKALKARKAEDDKDDTDLAGALKDPNISGSFKESQGVDVMQFANKALPGVFELTTGVKHVVEFKAGPIVCRSSLNGYNPKGFWLDENAYAMPTETPEGGVQMGWREL